jgi:creatinine amidohydrolase
MKTIKLLELHPRDLLKRVAKKPLVIIPIGTVEWHAAHMPLGTDNLLAQAICDDLSARTGCIVAPLLPCGICRDLQTERGFNGTLDTIREQTLSSLITDMLQGYAKMGFTKAAVFSGHFEQEHFSAISAGISGVSSIEGFFLTVFDFLQDVVRELNDVTKSWPYAGDHAAEFETSLMLAYFPKLVQMEKAPPTIELDMPGLPDYIRKRYPRRASLAYGNKLRRAIIRGGVERINDMLKSV